MEILRNSRKLKGSYIFVNEDFSSMEEELRRRLWLSSEENRQNGCEVSLKFDKHVVDRVAFAWDNEKGCRVRVTPERQI